MDILVTSSIIPYLNILYPHMRPPTTPGPQAPHLLNPALLLDVYNSACRQGRINEREAH